MATLGQRMAREDARRFVGRDRELGVLEAMLVDDPPASVAFVHGAGGIGKSALLRELARRHHRLADVDEVGRPRADRVDAQHAAVIG